MLKAYFSTILTYFFGRYIIIFQKIKENSLFPDIVFPGEKRYHICIAVSVWYGAVAQINYFLGGKDMRYRLENEQFKVEIDSFGAELKTVTRKIDGREYLWYADETYWGRISPVLFPFVGAPKNKEYRYDGKTYAMGQHGFARDMEFTLEKQEENRIWFFLNSTEETLAKYPFSFCLHIGYELVENEVKVLWRVENTDSREMYFSIGAHPAFLCPINGEEDKLGYGLHFGGLTDCVHHHGNTPEGMAVMEDEVLPLDNGKVIFTPGFFDKCTYMVEGKQTGEVSLLDKKGNPYVTVLFDAPLFAVWSPEGKNAPFVCIEPWYGRCDAVDFCGTLEQRAYENKLSAGEEFAAEYRMRFS